MGATLSGPEADAALGRAGDRGGDRGSPDAPASSLRPNRGRWDAMLARSTSALDAALRASLSADRRTAPLTRRQRAWAAGAALAGLGGVGGLAALAAFRPELGACEPAALTAAMAAAGLPVALCIRRAIVGAERRSAEATPEASPPGRSSPEASSSEAARPGRLRRLLGGLRGLDRRARRRARRQDRVVKRALSDIALRERRLAERIVAGDGTQHGGRHASPGSASAPTPAPMPRPAAVQRRTADASAARHAGRGTEEAPWTLPRDVAEALADLEARERLHAGRVAAARRAPTRPRPAAAPAPAVASCSGAAAPPRTRRHERIKPRSTHALVATADGRKLDVVVVDVSQSGVAVEGDLPGLWIGSMVTVGSRRAKAVRVLPRGMAFEFSMPVPAEALTADFVL